MEPTPAKGINLHKREFNPHRLRKKDLVWLWTNTCSEHGTSYAIHRSCWFRDYDAGIIKDCPIEEKIGFLDIETCDLSAPYGYVICYCIKNLDGKTITRAIESKHIKAEEYDKYLCKQVCEDLRKYDRLVGFYCSDRKFDFPFLRSRCLYWYNKAETDEERASLSFPEYMELYVEDLHLMVKGKLRLNNNRLATVARFFDIPAKATPITAQAKFRVMQGKQNGIDHYVTHCQEDVETTEAVWRLVHRFKRPSKTSI